MAVFDSRRVELMQLERSMAGFEFGVDGRGQDGVV
jgi:hypothetical protein